MDWSSFKEIEEYKERIFGKEKLAKLKELRENPPANFKVDTKLPLRDDQIQAVYYMNLCKKVFLFDGAGRGKTPMSLGYLTTLGSNIKAVVFTTSSLLSQWNSEVKKFTNFKSAIVKGNPRSRKQIYGEFIDSDYHILIMNFEKVKSDFTDMLPLFDSGKLTSVIFDEPTILMQHTNKTYPLFYRLTQNLNRAAILTATPLVNNVLEVYNLFAIFHIDNYLPSRPVFEREFLVKKKFTIYKGTYSFEVEKPKESKNVAQFRDLLDPFIIQREAKENPALEKIDRKFNAVRVLLSQQQAEICTNILKEFKQKSEEYKEFVRATKDYARIKDQGVIYGTRSISDQLAELLPIVQNPVKPVRVSEVYQNLIKVTTAPALYNHEYDSYAAYESPKINEFIKMLIENPLKKYVVFAQFLSTHKILTTAMDQLNINYVQITGEQTSQARETNKNKFNNSVGPNTKAYNVLLMTKAGRFGLNLQSATEVVLLDLPFSSADVFQYIARVYRTGQTNDVTVWFFISKNSIEEDIFNDVIIRKQNEIDLFSGTSDANLFKEQNIKRKIFYMRKNYMMPPYYSEKYLYNIVNLELGGKQDGEGPISNIEF